MQSEIETCANCGGKIGRMETPYVYRDQVVCGPCIERLRRPPPAPGGTPPQYQPAAVEHVFVDTRPQWASMATACPVCGSLKPAVKKAKGSIVLAILLLLLWILPGLIYWMFYQGYIYVCPDCGAKRADA